MTVKITMKLDNLPKIAAELRPKASLAVRKTAGEIWADIQEQMQGPKTGRIYKRGAKSHQASAPGEAPAVDTGELASSIQIAIESPLSAVVYSNMEYAPLLEFGTRHIAPRPAWVPAAERAKDPFAEALRRLLNAS